MTYDNINCNIYCIIYNTSDTDCLYVMCIIKSNNVYVKTRHIFAIN